MRSCTAWARADAETVPVVPADLLPWPPTALDAVPAWLDPESPDEDDRDWSRAIPGAEAWPPAEMWLAGGRAVRPSQAARVAAVLAEVDWLLGSLSEDEGTEDTGGGGLLAGLDADTAAAVLVDLVDTGRRVVGLTAVAVARCAASELWAGEGFRSVPAWLAARTTLSRGQAGDLHRLATRATAHPVMASAVIAGRVDPAHLGALAEAHRHYPRLSDALHAVETELTGYASTVDPGTFARSLTDRLHRIDPDAVDDADRARLRRQAYLTTNLHPDGYVTVTGVLPPEIGTGLRAALDAATRIPEPEAPQPGAPSAGASEPGPARSMPRRTRNLAGLARILTAAAAATGATRLPDVRGTRPVVHVTVPAAALLGTAGDAGQTTGTMHGCDAPVTTRAARRLACDADVRRILVDPDGLVLDVGRTTKVISPQLRIAITTRDRRCRFPGCRDAIDEIHHVVHWADGGRTDRRNTLGLCWFHHHEIHHGPWFLTGDADRDVTFTPGPNRAGVPWASRPRR